MSLSLTVLLNQYICHLEQLRNSKVMVLAASHLDMEILPELYERLSVNGKVRQLDVVLQCRGGEVNAARRIALLLRQYTEHLCFIVPYHCQSAATLLTLAADEVIAGELAIFSPIDPHLHGSTEESHNPTALSFQDILQLRQMAESWFGLDSAESGNAAFSLLCNNIFPPTLTAFYRTVQEMEQIATELLSYQLPAASMAERASIVQHLMSGYHSHSYGITREQMQKQGLCFSCHAETERLAWQISVILQQLIGGGLRQSVDASWLDVLLADSQKVKLRQKHPHSLAPQWMVPEDIYK